MKRIVVVLDGTPETEAVLPEAVKQAFATGAAVRLLRVLRPGLGLHLSADREDEREANLYLETVAEGLRSRGVRVDCRVRRGLYLSTVVEEASHADLVVALDPAASRTMSLLGSVLGSALATRAPCPVTLVQPRPAGEEAADQVRSFDVDAGTYGALVQRELGSRTVSLDRIVGSVGRAHELRADFRPYHAPAGDDRYFGIRRAMERGEDLPPIDLYKLGYFYYVLDGNHRVAAARACGQEEIDAVVIEFLPTNDPDAQRVSLERLAFEQATGLKRIGAAVPGHYPVLRTVIEAFARDRGLDDLRDAARRWYPQIYLPIAAALREARLHGVFPGERTADIFVHLAELRSREEDFLGRAISWDEALQLLVTRFRCCNHEARLRSAWQRAVRR